MNAKCWAYREDGRICGKPAIGIDEQRGCVVCEEHTRGECSNVEHFSYQGVGQEPGGAGVGAGVGAGGGAGAPDGGKSAS